MNILSRLFTFFAGAAIAGVILYVAVSENYEVFRADILSAGDGDCKRAVVNAVVFEKARFDAWRGDKDAQYNLGLLFMRGRLGSKDYNQARKLFEQAAASGHAGAALKLGRFYFYGNGVEVDEKAGAEWTLKAAELGSKEAAAIIGPLYMAGIGVEQNLVEAQKWMILSQNTDLDRLISLLEDFHRKLDQYPEAERELGMLVAKRVFSTEGRGHFDKMMQKMRVERGTVR